MRIRTTLMLVAVSCYLLSMISIVNQANGQAWQEEQLILPPIGQAFDGVNAIAIEDDWMFVPDGGGNVVNVYRRASGTWSLDQILAGDEIGEGFGSDVSISGDVLLVGAWKSSEALDQAGAAYVFRNVNGMWLFEDKITAGDPAVLSHFGRDLAIQGDVAIVGAKREGDRVGAVYIFLRQDSTWTEVQKLTPSDGFEGLGFGRDVAIDGARIAVGSHVPDSLIANGVSAVYIYELDLLGIWNETAVIRPADIVADDKFAMQIVLEDGLLVATSRQDDDLGVDAGAVYIYRFDGADWNLQQKVYSDSPYDNQLFGGQSLALENGTVVVASLQQYLRTTGEWIDVGQVHVLQETEGVWQTTDVLNNPLPESTHSYGTYRGFDLSQGTIAVYWSGYAPSGAVRTLTPQTAPAEKLVVVDSSADDAYEYDLNGNLLDDYSLGSGNNSPKGATTDSLGFRWIIDNDDYVYSYGPDGNKIGGWKASGLRTPDGITTDGTHLWIVDRGRDRVYYFENGASRTSGSASATSSFALTSGNKSPRGIHTDGSTFWIVNATRSKDRVYVYEMSGTSMGYWQLDSANRDPRGVTVDSEGNLLTVDSSTDQIYVYSGAASRTSGSQNADNSFGLDSSNYNPQGIAISP